MDKGRRDIAVKILYNDEALKGFRGGFGFSCWVEGKGILFDTGGDLATLLFNMQQLAIDPKVIGKIVLSHEHGDHVGGINIVNYCNEVDVFIPKSFSKRLKKQLASHPNVRIHEIDGAQEICEDVYTTGELGRSVKEQSLVVKTDNGLTVITGCAHPGLENILRVASRFGRIYGVIGGFHGFSKLEVLEEVRLIVPCHCTMRERELLDLYPTAYRKCFAGCTIHI